MFETWTLAVLAEMNSRAAISGLDRPSATRRSTSNSLEVRPSGVARAGLAPDPFPAGQILAFLARASISAASGRAPRQPASSAARRSRSVAAARSPAASAASAPRSSAPALG
jgi:hypothetical protein